MKYKKKFKKDGQIFSALTVVAMIINKEWIFYNHKPYHYGWTRSWTISFIEYAVNNGRIFKVKEIKDGRKENGTGSSPVIPEG